MVGIHCDLCNYKLLSWSELDIGDFYYHIHSRNFNIKTGKQSYFTIDDDSYHYWPKMLQENDYKNFVKCSFRILCNCDINEMLREWRKQF